MNSENTILLGLDNDGKKLFSNDYQHILLLAPPSSGKGVCFVIPSLLTFQESTIVHDIKLENYMLTSGYRASIRHKILVWNPLLVGKIKLIGTTLWILLTIMKKS